MALRRARDTRASSHISIKVILGTAIRHQNSGKELFTQDSSLEALCHFWALAWHKCGKLSSLAPPEPRKVAWSVEVAELRGVSSNFALDLKNADPAGASAPMGEALCMTPSMSPGLMSRHFPPHDAAVHRHEPTSAPVYRARWHQYA